MLKVSKIAFPGLGISEFEVDSVAFVIFGRPIAWYAIFITLGIAFCFFYVIWRTKKLGLTSDDIIDIGLVTVVAGILGGRAYFVLTSLHLYDSFWDFFKIWEGGIGIYGGLIAGGIAVFVMCRIKHVPFSAFADCTCPAVLMAQAVGRYGNFFNGEAFGSQTDIFCRMSLENDLTYLEFNTLGPVCVHPTFFYESLWNFIGFAIAFYLFPRRKYNGFIFHFCFAWYGFGRMFIELLRTDSLYISQTVHAWYTKISVLVGFFSFLAFAGLITYNLIRYYRGSEEVKNAMLPKVITVEERKAMLENIKKK